MRLTVLASIVVALTPAATGAQTVAGLRGVVMRGPTTPVCRIDQPCDEPAANVALVFSRSGYETRTRTTARGAYRVTLAPGIYAVRAVPAQQVGRGLEPRSVRVRAGTFRRVDFSLDTGIR